MYTTKKSHGVGQRSIWVVVNDDGKIVKDNHLSKWQAEQAAILMNALDREPSPARMARKAALKK